jgi:fatty acid desaturase
VTTSTTETIPGRVRTLLPQKLLAGVVFSVLFAFPYYANQYVSLRPMFPMPATWLDRAVSFQPGATWWYVSWYLMLFVSPALLATREQLWRYATGICVNGLVANLIFLLSPTGVARPLLTPGLDWVYRAVVTFDRPVNACPSLHAALAVFTTLWFARLCFTEPRLPLRRPRLWVAAMWLWTAAIFYATLATRQHVVLDLLAGSALGLLSYVATAGGSVSAARADKIADQRLPDCVLANRKVRKNLSAGLETEIAGLQKLCVTKRLLELAFFPLLWVAGAVVTLGALRLQGPARYAGYALGVVASAVALNGFVLLLHEGMHATLFAGRALNRWVSVALGGCVLISFTAYLVLHVRHHTYLGDERDPDDYHNYSASPRVVWLLHYVRLAAGAFLYVLLIPLLARRHGTPEERRRVTQEYAILLCVWSTAIVVVPTPVLVHAWLLPLVLVGYMTNIRGFTQHGLTDAHDPLLASRSMRPNPLVSFLLLNENLHLEHHLFPEVPSYSLGRLRRLIDPKLPRVIEGRSYLAFLGRFFRATFRGDERPVGLKVNPSAVAVEGGTNVGQ